ncbi:HAD-IA family hydrolase [Rubrivirga sp. S365]|uniref:HAD-IA family hydrolase n=1 Tax=Rubrivirga litoralis TaxID=3075598 RepID=A0ABU3BUB5_9BACT|nr:MULTISPECIES: HAD-IA family hydrolase [unclassified Rubrivirga]MDT0632825.1 HAD-IA family hydrolase [Rubrivirga sp. F394]MDT7855103.1 HAD-IA family hydrolase [Rubrivirga sp. S365]
MPALVVFDLDDTLLDHRGAERAALADVHRMHAAHLGHHGVGHVQDTYHAHNVPLWRDFGAGRITAADLKRLRSERVLHALEAHDLDPETFSRDYLARYAEHWRWADGALDAYRAVATRFPVGVLTNGFSEQQRAKFARLPEVEALAAFAVISDEVGVRKPDPRLFEHVLGLARGVLDRPALAPADVLYVGDSFHSDVEGGVGAGWRVAWLRGDDARAPEGAAVVEDWRALLDLLEIA